MKKKKNVIWLLAETIVLTAKDCKKNILKPDTPCNSPNAT